MAKPGNQGTREALPHLTPFFYLLSTSYYHKFAEGTRLYLNLDNGCISIFRLMSQEDSHKEVELSANEIFLNKIRNYVIRNIASEKFSLKALTI